MKIQDFFHELSIKPEQKEASRYNITVTKKLIAIKTMVLPYFNSAYIIKTCITPILILHFNNRLIKST